MKYVNQTKWFHKDGVPTAEVMHASMTSGPPFKGILSVTWWQIDSHIQGSIIIYESEETEKNYRPILLESRKSSPASMLEETTGPVLAQFSV